MTYKKIEIFSSNFILTFVLFLILGGLIGGCGDNKISSESADKVPDFISSVIGEQLLELVSPTQDYITKLDYISSENSSDESPKGVFVATLRTNDAFYNRTDYILRKAVLEKIPETEIIVLGRYDFSSENGKYIQYGTETIPDINLFGPKTPDNWLILGSPEYDEWLKHYESLPLCPKETKCVKGKKCSLSTQKKKDCRSRY